MECHDPNRLQVLRLPVFDNHIWPKDLETRQTGRCLREYKAQLGRVPEWFEYHASYAAAKGFEGRLPSLTEADHVNMVWRVPCANPKKQFSYTFGSKKSLVSS